MFSRHICETFIVLYKICLICSVSKTRSLTQSYKMGRPKCMLRFSLRQCFFNLFRFKAPSRTKNWRHPNTQKMTIWGTLSSEAQIKRQFLFTVICYSNFWRYPWFLFTAPWLRVTGLRIAMPSANMIEHALWNYPLRCTVYLNRKSCRCLDLKNGNKATISIVFVALRVLSSGGLIWLIL
jgi:hypothetical protein